MKKLRVPIVIIVLSVMVSTFFLPEFTPLDPQYLSPVMDAKYVNPETTIIVRYGVTLTQAVVSHMRFSVAGSISGFHTGTLLLAYDQKTVIYTPDQPFAAGEQVKFEISDVSLSFWRSYRQVNGEFTVSVSKNSDSETLTSTPVPTVQPASAFPDDLTVPQDIPHYTVTLSGGKTEPGYIFVSPFYWTSSTVGSYLLILDSQGNLVYYRNMAPALTAYDFTVQPNGLLSYYDQKDSTYYLLNNHYESAGSYRAGDGYTADTHEFLLFGNGYAFLMAQDPEPVDMSKVAPGGRKDATVEGLVVQELDPNKHVIFEWRSWDHFALTDSTANLTDRDIDLVHANSMALASDGNLLLSSRNLNEITKIDLKTGAILWRLGGKANQFTFIDQDEPFYYQHGITQLANGDIALFDNHGLQTDPAPSRAVEYRLDEAHKTATQVWEFSNNPPVFSTFMGNIQRFTNGYSFIGWGTTLNANGFTYMSLTELDANNQVVMQLAFDIPYVSYRAYLLSWHGQPDSLPDLAYKISGAGITLGYSWNGATGVDSYRVYGGSATDQLDLIESTPKTGFETQITLDNLSGTQCYFQVAAMDSKGAEMARSKVITTNTAVCPITA